MSDKNPSTCNGSLDLQPDGSAYCKQCGLTKTFPPKQARHNKPSKEDIAFNNGVEAAALVAESASLLFLSGSRKVVESLPERIRQLKK